MKIFYIVILTAYISVIFGGMIMSIGEVQPAYVVTWKMSIGFLIMSIWFVYMGYLLGKIDE